MAAHANRNEMTVIEHIAFTDTCMHVRMMSDAQALVPDTREKNDSLSAYVLPRGSAPW